MVGLMERLKTEPLLVADGAWGSVLIERGLDVTLEPADAWNLRHPDTLARLAEDYASHADMLSTNTFGANRARLARFDLDDLLREINTSGVNVARQALSRVHKGRAPLLIAGSMGPVHGPGDAKSDDGMLFDIFYEQAAVLTEAGASFILLETMMDLPETRVAVRAARAACSLEIVCSFAFRETGPGRFETWSGDPLVVALGTAIEEGADLVGANCIPANASLLPLIASMRQTAENRPLWLKPNAGQPKRNPDPAKAQRGSHVPPQPVMNYPCPLADAPIRHILDAMEAGVLGGCCGTSSADIGLIRRELNRREGLG